jgi:hypothetical protein
VDACFVLRLIHASSKTHKNACINSIDDGMIGEQDG